MIKRISRGLSVIFLLLAIIIFFLYSSPPSKGVTMEDLVPIGCTIALCTISVAAAAVSKIFD